MKQEVLRYRGREINTEHVAFVRELIDANPHASRRRLSKLVCEAWGWVQPNGTPRDMVCRGLLLQLHRAGEIKLPPVRCRPPNNVVLRRRRLPVVADTTPVYVPLGELRPLEIRLVRRTHDERLFDAWIEQHHYLGYVRPVGEHLKYIVFARARALACLALSSAARHLGPRDRFIGWSAEARRQNIRFIAYNTRFLILPWVRVPHLASHILGLVARQVSWDWERIYGHPIFFLETFIDPARFRGTCYRAANWIALGPTTGRGHNARTWRATQPKKEVLGLPLVLDFRARLGVAP